MYDIKKLEYEHKKTLDRITDLQELLLDRQNELKSIVKKGPSFGSMTELYWNKYIILYVQWVKYWVMGNSEEEINIKTDHRISIRNFSLIGSGAPIIQLSPPVAKLLDIDFDNQDIICVTNKKLVDIIINKCFPAKHKSIFSLSEKDYANTTIDIIRDKIYEYMNRMDRLHNQVNNS